MKVTSTVSIFLFLSVLHSCESCTERLWPYPQSVQCGSGTTQYISPIFEIRSIGENSPILERAMVRFLDLILPESKRTDQKKFATENPDARLISLLEVGVLGIDLSLQMDTDESYELIVQEDGSARVTAPTVYGAMYGMETFSQLISPRDLSVPDLPIEIEDFPRFPHRGMLLDTGRNFYPLEDVRRTIDALAYNRMNVFHWHIVEQQSFPMQSKFEPRLTEFGRYSPEEIYTVDQVLELVEYAQDRGVRIMPEFDTPGHTYSWGLFNPNLTVCALAEPWPTYCAEPPCGQLDPSVDEVYPLVEGLFGEMASYFPENFFHTGADEVNFPCWEQSETLRPWMEDMGFTTLTEVFQYFIDFEYDFLRSIDKTPVSWEEVFADNLDLPPGSVIQVWRGFDILAEVVEAGHRAILSNADAWYLDCGQGNWLIEGGNSWCDPYKTWQAMYENEPFAKFTEEQTKAYEGQVLGGESAMWSEMTDSSNLDDKVWPRTSAVGERLWSDRSKDSVFEALPRLEEHRDRLISRGIRCSSLQPKWCRENHGRCSF